MANKSRAIALDLINHRLAGKDTSRGFLLRVMYEPKLFGKQYRVATFDMPGKDYDIYFRGLERAINTAKFIDVMCEVSQRHAVREATQR